MASCRPPGSPVESARCLTAWPTELGGARWRQRLHISVNTVRTHLQNIMTKLGVHSALEAIAMVRRRSQSDPGDRPG